MNVTRFFSFRLINQLKFCGRIFLEPSLLQYESTCSYHKKNFLKLHCKLCRFQRISGQMHVECLGNPKHKQMEPFDHRLLWDDAREIVMHHGRHKFRQLSPEEIEFKKHKHQRSIRFSSKKSAQSQSKLRAEKS